MRKIIVVIVVGVIAAAGGAIGIRSWLQSRARGAEVERKVAEARTLMQSEKGWSDAKVALDAALLLAPDDVPALVARSEVQLRLKQLDGAVRDLDRASELSEGGEHARVMLMRGIALAERYRGANRDDDFRAAANSFLAAQQDAASEAEAIEALGFLYLKGRNQDYTKARRNFEELLQKHPDYVNAAKVREIVDVLNKTEKGG